MKKVKKIRIVSANKFSWYYRIAHYNCEFEVSEEFEKTYSIIVGGSNFMVNKKHTKIIEYAEFPYVERQAKWVEENNLHIGSKVRYAHSFKGWQDGFNYDNVARYYCATNEIYIVKSITNDHIKLEGIGYPVPYFALEFVKNK